MRRESLARPLKTSKRARTGNTNHIYSALCGIKKIPSAAHEGCILVPFALTAFVPERAIRKFAAHKPFAIHVDDGVTEHVVCYFGDIHKTSF
jgi:hypothetical protein